MRRVTARWSWGVAFLVIGGAVVGFLGYRRSLANRPPIAAVTPATQRIVAAPHSNRITAQFRIRNAGGRELVLGEASTTCGCTVASIQPKVLKAGEQGLVTVQGTSPNVGENTVSISVATNAESGKPVEFRLTMVGSSEVPFVSRSSGPVRLGFIRRGQEPEKVWIEAVEKPGETPWIRTASGTFPGLDVEGGVVKEGPYPGGARSSALMNIAPDFRGCPNRGRSGGRSPSEGQGPTRSSPCRSPAPSARRPMRRPRPCSPTACPRTALPSSR